MRPELEERDIWLKSYSKELSFKLSFKEPKEDPIRSSTHTT